MKILFVASEAAPFMKVGGLGEVMYSLPRALNRLGHDARVMIPLYATINLEKFPSSMLLESLPVPMGMTDPVMCNIKIRESQEHNGESSVTTYFLENMEYYEKRANVYGYDDDAARWALLSRGVLEFVKASNWKPDVIVCADWQTGFLPNYLKTVYKNDPFLKSIATVFSIHNLY